MDIEFVEFYLTTQDKEKNFFSGTLHIFLPDEQIDLRGIIVIFKNENWNFFLPHKMTQNPDGKNIRYPVYSKRDPAQSKVFLQKIIEKGKLFVAQKMDVML